LPVRRFQENDIKNFVSHITFFRIVIISLFSIVIFKFFLLQMIDFRKFYTMSIDNKIGMISKSALRGTIYDRNGVILARNNPSFDVAVVPEEIKSQKDVIIKRIGSILSVPDSQLFQNLSTAQSYRKYDPVILKRGLARDEVARLEENRDVLRSVEVNIEERRLYPLGNIASQVLGYIGFPSRDDLQARENLSMNTSIGKHGVEKIYDDILRGEDGWEAVLKDTYGRIKEAKGRQKVELKTLSKEPQSGTDIVLNLDANLQAYAESLLEGKKGAIVAIEPQTGEVLAMVSQPSFNPNIFVNGISNKEWQELIGTNGNPMMNKAIGGSYPPGSVFKVITTIAGLETGIITPDTSVHCSGEIKIGSRIFHCWKKGGHGTLNLDGAIRNSCNVFFYTVGKRLGADTILKYASILGFGKSTGLDYPFEIPGSLPDKRLKEKSSVTPSSASNSLTVAIGQGNIMVTPIQVARMMGAVATFGKLPKPKLLRSIGHEPLKEEKISSDDNLNMNSGTFAIIRKALWGVVNGGGTGGGARAAGIVVAGKTGTAQVVTRSVIKAYQEKGLPVPEQLMDHSWFAGFAPYDDPKIAFAIFVEHGGSGGKTAAPIAKKLIEFYFKDSNDGDEKLTSPT